MDNHLTDADRILMDRYFETVLLRFKEGRYSLQIATQELAETFAQAAGRESDFRVQMLGVTEAGDLA